MTCCSEPGANPPWLASAAMRPIIGITTRPRRIKSSAGESLAQTLQTTYSDAVERAGGIPVLLAPIATDDVPALLERIDGLVLSGGGDVDPCRYDGVESETMYGIDTARDEFELALVLRALELRLPTFAICRGMQILNVALGGTLVEDIPSQLGSTEHARAGDDAYVTHLSVRLADGCRLSAVMGTTELAVNSIHHQALRDLGDGLTAVGWSKDGLIEAVEHTDQEWPMLAVQWHPEYLGEAGDRPSWALFEALVKQATTGTG